MHDPVRDQLAAYAADTLPGALREEVAAHLAGCAACRAELAEWSALADAARRQAAARPAALPAWTPPVGAPPPARPSLTGRYRQATLMALLALGLLAAGVLLRTGSLGRSAPDRADSADLIARRGAEAGVDFAAGGRPAAESSGRSGLLSGSAGQAHLPGRSTFPVPAITPLAAVTPVGALASVPSVPSVPSVQSVPSVPTPLSTSTPPAPTTATTQPPAPEDPTHPEEPEEPSTPPLTSTPPSTPTPILSMPSVTATAPGGPAAGLALLAGRVHGPDGQPRAEIALVAVPLDAAVADRLASTDADGSYRLELPPGPWLLHAESPAYQLMWFGGSPNPLLARPLELAADRVQRADFFLEPSPPGLLRGQVLDSGGRPVDRALVLAAYPPLDPGDAPRPAASVFSAADGSFSLSVPPGTWFLAGATTWREPRLAWWGGDGSWEQAGGLAVGGEAAVEGLELVLGR